MLVDDKLAKEKLARELEKVPDEYAYVAMQCIELIRNTDLTDCQQQPMEDCSVTQAKVPPSINSSGTPKWNYTGPPPADNKDCRKLVTLREGGMTWIGIRAWNHQGRYWMNNNERELAKVHAWMELPDIARNFWDRGQLVDIDSNWPKPDTGTDSTRSGDQINPDGVADQGSVRNATDELDAKRYRSLRDRCCWEMGIPKFDAMTGKNYEKWSTYFFADETDPADHKALDEVIDAAIRALTVLEDDGRIDDTKIA